MKTTSKADTSCFHFLSVLISLAAALFLWDRDIPAFILFMAGSAFCWKLAVSK